MRNIHKLEPKDGNGCFGCGGSNPCGMKLSFDLDWDEQRTRGSFIIGPEFAGGAGFVHGGIIAVVLDETMGKLSRLAGEQAVTAELSIRYRRPVPVDQAILVEGWQEEVSGRSRFRVAEMKDLQGHVLARGKGRFVVVDPGEFRVVHGGSRVER